MNRPASDPQGFGHKTDSPIPKGAGFCRGPAPPRPLVEQQGQSSIFVSNEFHLFFPRHAASLPAASCLFKLFYLRALADERETFGLIQAVAKPSCFAGSISRCKL